MRSFKFDILIDAAEYLGYEYDLDVLRTMKEVYEKGEFYVAFIGQFSSGKSCLINNLFNRSFLPQGSLETTPLLTYVRYGEQDNAIIHYGDGHVEKISINEIADIVQKGESKKWNLDELDYIEVLINEPMLEQGMILLDTPGVNTLIEKHEQLLDKTLKLASKIIYVVGKAPSSVDIEKIKLMKEHGMDVALVRTHCDEIKDFEESKIDVLKNDEEALSDNGIAIKEMYHISNVKNSVWYNNIAVFRDMLKTVGKNISSLRENSLISQLDYFEVKYKNDLQAQLDLLIAQKNQDVQKIELQKKECMNRIESVKASYENISINTFNKINNDIKELKQEFQENFERNLEKAGEEIIKAKNITDAEQLRYLLNGLQRKVLIKSFNNLNTQINPLLENINGKFILDERVQAQIEIPEMESIDEIINANIDELAELKEELNIIKSRQNELTNSLVIAQDSADYIELKQELETLAKQLKELQAEEIELGEYVPQMIEIIDSGIKPSEVGKIIGNIADWALLLIPGGQASTAAKAAGTAAKAGSAAVKANKVTRTVAKIIGTAEKAGKIISKGKNVGDVANGLKNMGKVYATQRRIKTAQELIKAGTEVTKQALNKKGDQESVLDYLSLEHWGKKIGSCFDDPPKYEEDQEYRLAYHKESERIRKTILQIQQTAFEKKCKLGLYETQKAKEEARLQSLLVDEKKYQNELLKKEDSIKEQAKRTAINRWLSNSQAIFFEKTKEVVWPLLQDYFETIPRHLEEYLEKRLSSQTLIIERENERLEKMLLLKPDKVEKEIDKVNSLLNDLLVSD